MTPKRAFIYCFFGDVAAIPVIHAFQGIRTKKLSTALQNASSDGDLLWSGQLLVKGRDEATELAVGILHSGPDIDARLRSLGFEPENQLRVEGKTSLSSGLVNLFTGSSNVAYLRDYLRWPLRNYEQRAAIKLLDSFAAHRYLRQKKEPRSWRRPNKRDADSLHLASA